jgi:hypothetical protein
MFIYYLETHSGQSFLSYVHASADRFFENNKKDVRAFYAFNMAHLNTHVDIYNALSKDKAEELLAYYDWVRYHDDGIREEYRDGYVQDIR